MNPIILEYENLRRVNEPFFKLYKEKFDLFLDSGWFILGESVEAFENEYSEFCNTKSTIGVASGLDALILAIDAFSFPEGSEIIVPSNTYIATIMAIIRNGFKPILVEPDIETYNINPLLIEEKITHKTKAILVVHLYGKCCDMGLIKQLADNYSLEIIEDVAQAHGAKYKGQMAGSFGVGCHSFYPTKNLGALGDAGAITTNNDSYANKLRMLRNYGSKVKYYNSVLGYNSRLDELQASFLSVKLKHIAEITQHKRELAKLYFENLSDVFIKPKQDEDFYDVFHIFNIRHAKRDLIRDHLFSNNIKTEIHYPISPYKQKSMSGFFTEDYPVSDLIHSTTLSLPISFYHTKNDVFRVIESLNGWAK